MSNLSPHQFTPQALQQHANEYAEENPQLADPFCAHGMCEGASHEFLQHVGINRPGSYRSDETRGYAHEEFRSAYQNHMYAVVHTTRGPYAVDHTARQFDAKQPFPVVRRAEDHQRWLDHVFARGSGGVPGKLAPVRSNFRGSGI